MTVSVFDLFQIGVGPSSSHTVGPMRAGLSFAGDLKAILDTQEESTSSETPPDTSLKQLADDGPHAKIADVVTPPATEETAISIILYGSLAATGSGHGTLGACLLGLDGCDPATVDPDYMDMRLKQIRDTRRINLAGDPNRPVVCGFEDIILRPTIRRTIHTNAVTFVAHASTRGDSNPVDADNSSKDCSEDLSAAEPRRDNDSEAMPGAKGFKQTYYSIGGGFIRTDEEKPSLDGLSGPWLFTSGDQLIELAQRAGLAISEIQRNCEQSMRTDDEINENLDAIAQAMEDCSKRGMTFDGVLPGSLHVRRRAKRWYDQLLDEDPHHTAEFSEDWVNLIALAVNEENAAGGRVVTAPTNGAAGIIPAVLFYARNFTPAGRDDPREVNRRFLLAAGAIGSLYKERASISGAEVGCQGEVGSAASMAAAGLAEVLGGSPRQVANAAEIAMEHSLGLTCDPIGGLVQIPCIERNAISAGKAINAAKMALRGDGDHHVTLDEVIETMRQTGADMSDKYKETAGGGLATNVAVNVPEC